MYDIIAIYMMSFCRYIFFAIIGMLTLLPSSYATSSNLQGVNQAAVVLCDVIQILRGRIGRAITMIAVLGIALSFLKGSITWSAIMTFVTGIGLFYGAETFAYLMLPSTISGVTGTMPSGKVFLANQKYTPEEIVREVCPALTNE